MPPRSDEIYIDEDDDDEDEEKDERDDAGNLLIVQDRLFSGAVDWAHLHSGYVVLVSQDVDGVKHVELRKPTKAERFLILKNYIQDHPRAQIRVSFFAKKLNVSERTIQTALRLLEKYHIIESVPTFTETGRQRGNRYKYVARDKTTFTPARATLEALYDPANPYGYRDWHWQGYKFVPGVFSDRYSYKEQLDAYHELQFKKVLNYKKKFDMMTEGMKKYPAFRKKAAKSESKK
jgi:hypothetical protein